MFIDINDLFKIHKEGMMVDGKQKKLKYFQRLIQDFPVAGANSKRCAKLLFVQIFPRCMKMKKNGSRERVGARPKFY